MKLITSETKLPPYIQKIFKDSSFYIQAQHVPVKAVNEIIHIPYLFWSKNTPIQVAIFIKSSNDIFNSIYTSKVKATERILSDCIERKTYTIILSVAMSKNELLFAKKNKISILDMSEKRIRFYRND